MNRMMMIIIKIKNLMMSLKKNMKLTQEKENQKINF
jgi:hypothetical protein